MKRLTRALGTASLVMVVVMAAAMPAAGAGNHVERPFKAKATGTNTIVVEDCVGAAVVTCPQETATTLIGTHLGRSTSNGSGSVVLDFGAPACTGTNGAPGAPFVSVQAVVTIAANGDELYSQNTTTGCFVDFEVGTQAIGSYVITGGTGRFAGAAGSGSLEAAVLGDELNSRWRGTITY